MRAFLIAIPIVLIGMSMSAAREAPVRPGSKDLQAQWGPPVRPESRGLLAQRGPQDQQVKRPLWTRMNFNWFSNSWKAISRRI